MQMRDSSGGNFHTAPLMRWGWYENTRESLSFYRDISYVCETRRKNYYQKKIDIDVSNLGGPRGFSVIAPWTCSSPFISEASAKVNFSYRTKFYFGSLEINWNIKNLENKLPKWLKFAQIFERWKHYLLLVNFSQLKIYLRNIKEIFSGVVEKLI